MEGKTGMLFSHPGVAETVLYVSPEEAPDEILAAALLTLVEGTTREDGTAAVYLSTRATNDDPFAAFLASDRCLSVALADRDGVETAHVLVKANVTSLDDCPSPPVPSDFDDDGAALDLEALGADGAVLAPPGCRPRRHVARRHPRRVERRDPLRTHSATRRRDRDRLLLRAPGLRAQRVALHRPGRSHARGRCERGAFRGDRGGFRRRTRVEKRRVQAHPGTAGSPGSRVCAAMVVSGDAAVSFSNGADAEDRAEATCPKSPRAEMFEGELDEDLLEKTTPRRCNLCEGSCHPVTRRSESFVHPARAKTKDKNHQPLKGRSTDQTHP